MSADVRPALRCHAPADRSTAATDKTGARSRLRETTGATVEPAYVTLLGQTADDWL